MTTKAEIRTAIDADAAKRLDTQSLREHFHVGDLFRPGEIKLVYNRYNHSLLGTVVPFGTTLVLDNVPETGTLSMLDRREMAVLNIGKKGMIRVAGKHYELARGDAVYIGMGAGPIEFSGDGRFYLVSAPAIKQYPTKLVCGEDALFVEQGCKEDRDERVDIHLIHPDVCQSCQLRMGYTQLLEDSIWNKPPTARNQSEIFLYFDMRQKQCAFHFMGQINETRHLVIVNEEAVISPSWSIHAVSSTCDFSCCWAMTSNGPDDTDIISMSTLK